MNTLKMMTGNRSAPSRTNPYFARMATVTPAEFGSLTLFCGISGGALRVQTKSLVNGAFTTAQLYGHENDKI